MNALNRFCSVVYEIGLLGTILLCILAPFHGSLTQYFSVVRSVDASHVVVTGDPADLAAVPIGAPVDLYRFKSGWKSVVKSASVESKSESEMVITFETTKGRVGASNRVGATATQVIYFPRGFFFWLEIFVILGVFGLYTIVRGVTRKSPFVLVSDALRKIRVPKHLIFWLVNIAAVVPFVWFLGQMPVRLLLYIAHAIFRFRADDAAIVATLAPYLYAGIGIWYCTFLGWKRRSPVLAFWHFLSYKKPSTVKNISFERGVFLWALYLVVVYAFASTLLNFLHGNLLAMKQIGWPAPSLAATFDSLKYGVWSLTVVGCLIGYGHSVVSILWGRYVRHLDFTVVGWLTNGFCYPLFGVVIWQMIPSFYGNNPIITDGGLQVLMLGMGLFLNVFYMLSIWNLGPMFGLMSDKGVRTFGFYSVVRHPSYMLEVLMFLVTEMVSLTTGVQWLSICMYFFLYWIRSEREDNFMWYANPKYREYQEKTPYKFIPGVY